MSIWQQYKRIKNKNRKWYELWKPRFVWKVVNKF